jgi:hypothetical protein
MLKTTLKGIAYFLIALLLITAEAFVLDYVGIDLSESLPYVSILMYLIVVLVPMIAIYNLSSIKIGLALVWIFAIFTAGIDCLFAIFVISVLIIIATFEKIKEKK